MATEQEHVEYFQRGYRLYKRGNIGLAMKNFQKALDFHPSGCNLRDKDPLYLSFYGVTLARVKGDTITARKLCEAALRSGQSYPEVFLNLGRVFEEMKEYCKAADAYRRGYRMHRDNLELLESLQRVSPRRPNVIPFLDRNHLLNKVAGKILRRAGRSTA
ncbi:hypothetical protein JXA80_05140 [bacterium]|nr:hypothetical protein [candidate division CSSED10-310 bacterium]